MQFDERVGMLDGHLRRELPAPPAGADLFATRAAVDPPAALELDQIATVAEHGTVFLHQAHDRRFHLSSFEATGRRQHAAAAPTMPASGPRAAVTIGTSRLASAQMCARVESTKLCQ